jgi:hypothetical protein
VIVSIRIFATTSAGSVRGPGILTAGKEQKSFTQTITIATYTVGSANTYIQRNCLVRDKESPSRQRRSKLSVSLVSWRQSLRPCLCLAYALDWAIAELLGQDAEEGHT